MSFIYEFTDSRRATRILLYSVDVPVSLCQRAGML
ncbi:hypothetical protein BVRB_8g183060 [Beta vulgaris subsp. vulgaris]|nr:hypothetical protein BVRB_8g183060 [Beta vulgaris subsp. vulgaris]